VLRLMFKNRNCSRRSTFLSFISSFNGSHNGALHFSLTYVDLRAARCLYTAKEIIISDRKNAWAIARLNSNDITIYVHVKTLAQSVAKIPSYIGFCKEDYTRIKISENKF